MAKGWLTLELRQDPADATGKILAATCLLLLAFFWFALTLGPAEERVISPAILPSPAEVIAAIPNLLFERDLGQSIFATMTRVLLGFSLALLIGVPLGVLAGSWRALDAFLTPIVIPMSNVPVAALIPLTILWFGIGESQKVMFIFVAAVPFVFATAAGAILAVPDRYVDTARTLGASDRQIVLKVLVPTAMPEMYRGLRGLFGLSFGYIMLAELINAPHGLGAMLNVSQRRGLTEHIFLILAIIGLIAWAIDHALAFTERRLFRDHEPFVNLTSSKPVFFCALGLFAAFLMPWIEGPAGLGMSGYSLGQLGSYANYAWVVPILAGATLFVSISGINNRVVGFVAGIVPIAAITYFLTRLTVEDGSDVTRGVLDVAKNVLAIGAWLTLAFSVALIVASLVPSAAFYAPKVIPDAR